MTRTLKATAFAIAALALRPALAGQVGLPTSSPLALYDRIRGQWLVRDGTHLVLLGPGGKQSFSMPRLEPSTSFAPVAVANGWVLAVVGGGEGEPGELAIADATGKWVGERPLPFGSKLAQDGSALVTVDSTWSEDAATIGGLIHEKLPEGFRGMVVRSCTLPTWSCRVDLYPDLNQPVQDFWPLGHGDVLVSLGEGSLGRFRFGERLWLTDAPVGYLPLFLDVSIARGELLVVDRPFARLTVYALGSGAPLFAWDPAKDKTFLAAFVGKEGTAGLRRWCSLRDKGEEPAGQLFQATPQGQGAPGEAAWAVAAAGDELSATILPNGDLAVAGGNAGSSRGVECPNRGWLWIVSREKASVVRAASLFTLAQKLRWPLDLPAGGDIGFQLTALATDGKGMFFVCSYVSTGCFSFPLQALAPVVP